MTKDEVKGDKGSVSLENHTTWHLGAKILPGEMAETTCLLVLSFV